MCGVGCFGIVVVLLLICWNGLGLDIVLIRLWISFLVVSSSVWLLLGFLCVVWC